MSVRWLTCKPEGVTGDNNQVDVLKLWQVPESYLLGDDVVT